MVAMIAQGDAYIHARKVHLESRRMGLKIIEHCDNELKRTTIEEKIPIIFCFAAWVTDGQGVTETRNATGSCLFA